MTLSDLRKWLATLADAHALVPAEEVLERLPVVTEGEEVDPLGAMDVDAAGAVLGRSASTVRDYCRRDLLPGSFRQQGREWRIPASAISAFHAKEARGAEKPNGAGRHDDDDLSAWRKELPAA